MRLPFFQSGKPELPPCEALVVIGVHREEVAFGRAVAAQLDPEQFDIMVVERGLSARRPRPDQLQAYLDNHAALYDQIAGNAGQKHGLLIDLHCRLKGDADADIFAADEDILKLVAAERLDDASLVGKKVRMIRMVSDEDLTDITPDALRSQLFSKPEFPETVWRAERPLYVGLEIYLEQEGEGTREEQIFASDLIGTLRKICLTAPEIKEKEG